MRHFFGSHEQSTFHNNNMHIRCCDLYTDTVVNENGHDHVTYRDRASSN